MNSPEPPRPSARRADRAALKARLPGLAELHRAGLSGAGVGIGHLDSGVAAAELALGDHISAFRRYDRFGEPLAGHVEADDHSGHGSQTATLVTTIACNASLASAAVIEGGYVALRLLRGLDWLLDQPIRIALLPVGLREHGPLFWHLITALRDRDILPIAAIGNGAAGVAHAPGYYPQLLSVGALDRDGSVAAYSGSLNEGLVCHKPDLVAAGSDLATCDHHGQACTVSGTSAAAAVVTGIAALLLEAQPQASADQLEQALLSSCQAVEPQQSHRVRCGALDAAAALRRLEQACQQRTARPVHSSVTGHAAPAPRYIQPRLSQRLGTGDPDEHLPVIVMSSSQHPLAHHALMQRTQAATHASPRTQHHLNCARALYLLAPRHYLRRLVQDPEIHVATLAEGEHCHGLCLFGAAPNPNLRERASVPVA